MSVSDFDLAAALGLDRPLETARMLAMVAEQRKQRDDARRNIVERCRVGWSGLVSSLREVALKMGWGYLYPEEPEPAVHEDQEDCDACKGEGVLAKDIEAHEAETGCEERHDIDDDGAHCRCGVTLPACAGCADYSLGRKRP